MSNPYAQSYNNFGMAFGVNPSVLTEIGRLESGHRPGAANNWDSNAKKGTPSKGIMQFIQPTFDAFYRQASSARPDIFRTLGEKNWMDPRQQIATTAWALANGKGSHWATYDKALSKAGGKLRVAKGQFSPEAQQNASQVQMQTNVTGGPDEDKLKAYERLVEWDAPRWSRSMRKYIKDNPYKQETISVPDPQSASWDPQGSNPMQRMKSFIDRFGVRFDSGSPWGANPQQGGGSHTGNSWHYANKAFDVGDAKNRELLYGNQLKNYVRNNPQVFREAFFNPWGFGVKNGKLVEGLKVDGHGNHGHFAFY